MKSSVWLARKLRVSLTTMVAEIVPAFASHFRDNRITEPADAEQKTPAAAGAFGSDECRDQALAAS